jgi:Flp pilus assembly protein TadB
MWSFFRNLWLGVLVTVLAGPFICWKIRKGLIARFDRRLEKEFADILVVFSGSLTAGLSLNQCVRDIAEQTPGEYPLLSKEFARMEQLLRLNWPVERVFEELADRCDHPDIKLFSTVLLAGIPAGVNLVELVRQVAATLRMKQDTEAEITRILNLPKYNHRIIMAMPVVSVITIRWMAPSYAAGLETGLGLILLIGACVLLGLAILLGEFLGRIRY